MAGQSFEQRVRTVVEFRGDGADRALLDETMEERGWPVLRSRTVVPDEPATPPWTELEIEVRLPGDRRGAAEGAAARLHLLRAERALDLKVLVARPLSVGPDNRVPWRAYRPRSGRGLARLVGRRDTGLYIPAADRAEALARAAAHTPDGPVGVRLEWGISEPPPGGRPVGPGPSPRRTNVLLALAIASATFAGSLLPGGPLLGPRGTAAVLALVAAVTVLVQLTAYGAVRRRMASRVAFCLCLVAFFGLVGWGTGRLAPNPAFAPLLYPALGYAAFVSAGLWTLVRQWTPRETLAWSVPLVATLVTTVWGDLGGTLHWAYLRAFGLSPEDVPVPAVSRALAAATFLVFVPLWLLAAALWGYAKHFHRLHRDRWVPAVMVAFMAVTGTLIPALLVLGKAESAGARAWHRASEWASPTGYYGLTPELRCVRPLKRAVPSDGGELAPGRPYLFFAETGGTTVLWDIKRALPLKVPSATVRTIPVRDGTQRCGPG